MPVPTLESFDLERLGAKIARLEEESAKMRRGPLCEALDVFFEVREIPGLKKKPSTSELIDWLKLLLSDDIPEEVLKSRDPSQVIPPLYGALLKNEQDVHMLQRLAFMVRRDAQSN